MSSKDAFRSPGGSELVRNSNGQPIAPSAQEDSGDITIFLSYSRADDEVYGMIRPFKEMLGHLIYAKSGRRVRAFLDQESIEWGELWHDRLESEIRNATVFIPLLSASYLDSENCRMEFNRFQSNATSLGVRELLLPVLLLNAPSIFNANSTDDVVKQAAARQWEVIEDAVFSDEKSSAWKKTMARLADRFVRAYESAESKLADMEAPALTGGMEPGEEEDDNEPEKVETDDEPGIVEITTSLNAGLAELTDSSADMSPAIAALGAAAAEASTLLKSNPAADQAQVWSLKMARAFVEPAETVSAAGERMFNATTQIDLDMQRIRQIATSFLPDSPQLAETYNTWVAQLNGLDEVSAQLHGLLSKMKPAENFSIPLRKALLPARRGLTRVTDSVRLINTWEMIDIDEE